MLTDLLLIANQRLVEVGEITKRKVIDYKLNKKCPREDIVKIKLPPKVISDCYVNISELERRRFGEILTYFTRVVERNFISLDLDYFYNNIKTLDIKKFRENILLPSVNYKDTDFKYKRIKGIKKFGNKKFIKKRNKM